MRSVLVLAVSMLMVSGILYPVSAIGVQLYGCGTGGGTEYVYPNSEIGINYDIHNSDNQNYQIGLGASLTSTSGQTYSDPASDQVVNVNPSSNQYANTHSRSFNLLDAGVPPGTYSLTCAIWLGRPGYGQWLDSRTYQNALVVNGQTMNSVTFNIFFSGGQINGAHVTVYDHWMGNVITQGDGVANCSTCGVNIQVQLADGTYYVAVAAVVTSTGGPGQNAIGAQTITVTGPSSFTIDVTAFSP